MLNFFFFFYLSALMASLVSYKKFVDTPLRYFPLLIAYTLFNEVLGYFIINYKEFSFFEEEEYQWHNVIIYNIYGLIFLGYFLKLYHNLLENQSHKQFIKVSAVLLGIAYTVSLFFQDPFHSDLFYADSLASLILITIILLHFRQLKARNGGINRYNLMTWINSGLLLFEVFFPFYILTGYFNGEFFLDFHLRQVLWVIITVMYSLFTIGFLISRRSAFR